MQFVREKLAGTFADNIEATLWERLGEDYRPVISGGKHEFLQILGNDYHFDKVGGDIFICSDGTLLFYQMERDDNRNVLVAGAAWDDKSGSERWQDFRDRVSTLTGNKSWLPAPFVSKRFQMLQEELTPLVVGGWERNAAVYMFDANVRRTLRKVASNPAISLQDVAEERSLAEVGQEVQSMESLNIINRVYDVFCRKFNEKISRVRNMKALEEAAAHGFRCFHCGNVISDELIVQALTVTPEGQRLAKPNMWLAFLVGATLIDMGVEPSSIFFRDELRHSGVEIFADIDGSLLMFSVAEDGVPPQEAFRFCRRVDYFKPDFAFLVSPVPVASECHKVLKSYAANLFLCEGLEDLKVSMERVKNLLSRRVLDHLLESFNAKTVFPIDKVVGAYFLGDASVGLAFDAASSVKSAESVREDNESALVEESAQKEAIQLPAHIREMNVLDGHINKIISMLPRVNSSNETDELAEVLQAISSISGASSMVASDEGMPFMGSMETFPDGEAAAALQPDLMRSVNEIMERGKLDRLQGLVVLGDENCLGFFPGGDGLALIMHRRYVADADIKNVKLPQVKVSEREAFFEKTLRSMEQDQGVRGSVILRRTGGIMQSCGKAVTPDVFQSLVDVVPDIVQDCVEPLLRDLNLGTLRAVLMRTKNCWYDIVPIKDKAFLAGILQPGTGAEVWSDHMLMQAHLLSAGIR